MNILAIMYGVALDLTFRKSLQPFVDDFPIYPTIYVDEIPMIQPSLIVHMSSQTLIHILIRLFLLMKCTIIH